MTDPRQPCGDPPLDPPDGDTLPVKCEGCGEWVNRVWRIGGVDLCADCDEAELILRENQTTK